MALTDRRPSRALIAVMIVGLAAIMVASAVTGEWGFLVLAIVVAAAAAVPLMGRR